MECGDLPMASSIEIVFEVLKTLEIHRSLRLALIESPEIVLGQMEFSII